MNRAAMPWDFLLLLAILAIVVPWRGAVRIRQILLAPSIGAKDRLVLYASTIAFQWLGTFIAFWRCMARGYSTHQLALALPQPVKTLAIALILVALVTANQIFSIRRLARLPVEKQGSVAEITRRLVPRSLEENLVFLALVATVAVCEEFIYRGFVQAAFQNLLFESALLGALSSALFFSAAHLYQGRRGLIITFFAGILFSFLRLWTASLLPSVAAHFAADFSASLAAQRWFPQTAARALVNAAGARTSGL